MVSRHLSVLIVSVVCLTVIAPMIVSAGPLVPCGLRGQTGEDAFCQFCHLFTLVQRLFNFLWWYIAIPIATIMLIWGGLYMLIPAASPAHFERGKKILTSTVIGLVIIFVAWLGVDTVLKFLQFRGTGEGDASFGPWNKIQCTPVVLPIASPSGPVVAMCDETTFVNCCGNGEPPESANNEQCEPPGTATCSETCQSIEPIDTTGYQCNDEEILLAGSLLPLTQGTVESCGSAGSADTLANIQSQQPPPVCFAGCTPASACPPDSDVHLSLMMLNKIDAVRAVIGGSSFQIASLTTGSHSAGSSHYSGGAVDLRALNTLDYPALETLLSQAPFAASFVQCEHAGAEVNCNGSEGHPDHIHASFPAFSGALESCG